MCPERTRLLLSLLPVSSFSAVAGEVLLRLRKLRRAHFPGSWECTLEEALCRKEVENKDSEKSVHPVRVPHEAYGSALCSHVLSGRQKQDSRDILSQTHKVSGSWGWKKSNRLGPPDRFMGQLCPRNLLTASNCILFTDIKGRSYRIH